MSPRNKSPIGTFSLCLPISYDCPQTDLFDLLFRQSHLPPTMRYDPSSQPNNEMGYYLEGRFEEWNESILRPLVYYCLHHPPEKPPTSSIAALAQRYMTLCVDSITRCSNHDRHGGTWFVLRRAFRCTLVILAAVVADGPLRPPENWPEL